MSYLKKSAERPPSHPAPDPASDPTMIPSGRMGEEATRRFKQRSIDAARDLRGNLAGWEEAPTPAIDTCLLWPPIRLFRQS